MWCKRREIDGRRFTADEICDDVGGPGSEQDAVAMVASGQKLRCSSGAARLLDRADEGKLIRSGRTKTGPAIDLGGIGCRRPEGRGAAAQEGEGSRIDQLGIAGVF